LNSISIILSLDYCDLNLVATSSSRLLDHEVVFYIRRPVLYIKLQKMIIKTFDWL